MSITLNGVIVGLPLNFIPDGYTHTPVTKTASVDYVGREIEVTVLKSSVVDTTPLATFNALDTAVQIEVITHLEKYYDVNEIINAYAIWHKVETLSDIPEKDGYYTDVTVTEEYKATIKIFVELV